MTAPIPIRTPDTTAPLAVVVSPPPRPVEVPATISAELARLRAEVAELRATVARLRAAQTAGGTVLTVADRLVLDLDAGQAHLDGAPLALTRREWQLLSHLAQHPGRLYSRLELLEQVWGTRFQDPATVTEHVRRLRARIPLRLISTVRGTGYRWDGPTPTATTTAVR